jgi:hypothetical protein
MSFVAPLLPSKRFPTHKEVACWADCLVAAVYKLIKHGELATVTVLERLLIAESDAERFIREWTSDNRGVSARWREYRAWKDGRRGTKPAGAR